MTFDDLLAKCCVLPQVALWGKGILCNMRMCSLLFLLLQTKNLLSNKPPSPCNDSCGFKAFIKLLPNTQYIVAHTGMGARVNIFKYYYTDPFGKLHANDSLNEHINVDSIRIHLNR